MEPAPRLDASRRGLPGLRWYICGLLFFATTVNYIDRQVIGILKPVLERELGWSEADYGWIVFAFQLAYALMMPITGRIVDWLGVRLGYLLAVTVWSVAAMAHSLAGSAAGFSIARFALGVGEAANFPAAVRAVTDWFPKKERALATGIFNSGSNVGAIVAPLAVPWIAVHWGWRAAFIATGALGFIWIAAWWLLFRQPREHSLLSSRELALIEAGGAEETAAAPPYTRILRTRAAWVFLLGKFMTDPVWWFYLFWLPGFLNRTYGLNLTQLGAPLIAIYLAADVGSVGGGWISSTLLARGKSTTFARKTAMLTCALAVVPVSTIMFTGGQLWLVVTLISIAAAAHQGWSANLYTLVSDTFPKASVASVIGLGGMGGAIGGMLVSPAVGYWLDASHGRYGPLFFIAGSMYLAALLLIHLLMPRIEPADLS